MPLHLKQAKVTANKSEIKKWWIPRIGAVPQKAVGARHKNSAMLHSNLHKIYKLRRAQWNMYHEKGKLNFPPAFCLSYSYVQSLLYLAPAPISLHILFLCRRRHHHHQHCVVVLHRKNVPTRGAHSNRGSTTTQCFETIAMACAGYNI